MIKVEYRLTYGDNWLPIKEDSVLQQLVNAINETDPEDDILQDVLNSVLKKIHGEYRCVFYRYAKNGDIVFDKKYGCKYVVKSGDEKKFYLQPFGADVCVSNFSDFVFEDGATVGGYEF